jgi:hypothetical protein
MIIPTFHSGLGNQLFQLSAAYTLAKKTNNMIGIHPHLFIKSSHSPLNYNETIFKKLQQFTIPFSPTKLIHQHGPYNEEDTIKQIREYTQEAIHINGYFQDERTFRGFRREILSLLNFGDSASAIQSAGYSADVLSKSFFIHFRRGDYVGSSFWIDLDAYYKNVIEMARKQFGDHITFVIISDDISYCKSEIEWLQGLTCRFVDESLSEIDTMYLMSKCQLGGAAPNSTFSWWGLYLNVERPLLCIPNCENDCYKVELFKFPEATVVDNLKVDA